MWLVDHRIQSEKERDRQLLSTAVATRRSTDIVMSLSDVVFLPSSQSMTRLKGSDNLATVRALVDEKWIDPYHYLRDHRSTSLSLSRVSSYLAGDIAFSAIRHKVSTFILLKTRDAHGWWQQCFASYRCYFSSFFTCCFCLFDLSLKDSSSQLRNFRFSRSPSKCSQMIRNHHDRSLSLCLYNIPFILSMTRQVWKRVRCEHGARSQLKRIYLQESASKIKVSRSKSPSW